MKLIGIIIILFFILAYILFMVVSIKHSIKNINKYKKQIKWLQSKK